MEGNALKTEAQLKGELVIELKAQFPDAVILRHEDIFTAGVPDLSVTWHGWTSWYEVKHATPRIKGKNLQLLTMLQLAKAGKAWYLIYQEDAEGNNPRTRLVEPKVIYNKSLDTTFGIETKGFDHKFVVDFIRRVHQ